MSGVLAPGEIRLITSQIVGVMQPQRVIVFGSYAKGKATPRSDLDILVVVDEGSTWWPCDVLPYLSRSIVPVDLHIIGAEEFDEYRREEHHFFHSVNRSGKVVYTRAGTRRSDAGGDRAERCGGFDAGAAG